MNKNTQIKSVSLPSLKSFAAIAVLIFPLGAAVFLNGVASATTMTNTSVVETNMNAGGSANANVFVQFKPAVSDSSTSLVVTFPTGFTLTSSSDTVGAGGCTSFFSGDTAMSTSSATATESGAGPSTITVSPNATMTTSNTYCFYLSNASGLVTTNPSAGNYNTTISDAAENQTQGIDIISNDQIAVTASISQFFTLTFGANSDTITGASPSSYVKSGGVTLTAATNATSGWGLWAEDSNAGLHSSNASKTINSVATGSGTNFNGANQGTEKYGFNVTAVSGTGAAMTNYNGTTNNYAGSGLSSSTYNEFADATATGTGTATVNELLDVAPTTPNATDYSDTITIVGDGSF